MRAVSSRASSVVDIPKGMPLVFRLGHQRLRSSISIPAGASVNYYLTLEHAYVRGSELSRHLLRSTPVSPRLFWRHPYTQSGFLKYLKPSRCWSIYCRAFKR